MTAYVYSTLQPTAKPEEYTARSKLEIYSPWWLFLLLLYPFLSHKMNEINEPNLIELKS